MSNPHTMSPEQIARLTLRAGSPEFRGALVFKATHLYMRNALGERVLVLAEREPTTFELVNGDMLDSIKRNMAGARVVVAAERTCLSCGARTVNGVLPCGH